jgi:hypothetical protein
MELIFSYGLVDSTGKARQGISEEVYRPRSPFLSDYAKEMSGDSFSTSDESTFFATLSDGRTICIYWNAVLFDGEVRVSEIQAGPRILAIVRAFGHHDLVARSEPTTDGRLGVNIHNREGKVLLTGLGDVGVSESGPWFAAQGREIFRWQRASPSSCAHTNYAIRNPGTTPVKLKDAPPDAGS